MARTQDSNKADKKAGVLKGTKLELTLAAEKMFALNGLHGTTLRQIREEAGQKNESVIHYHFGSREAIIQSILHLRTQPIDQRRKALLLEELRRHKGCLPDSATIIRLRSMPLAHYLLDDDKPGYYLRFLLQLRSDRVAWRYFIGQYDEALRACLNITIESKPNMPRRILEQRFVSTMFVYLSGMAALEEAKSEKDGDFRVEEAWIRIEDLIATSVALMDAPLSTATLAAIWKAEELGIGSYGDVSIHARKRVPNYGLTDCEIIPQD